MPQNWAEITRTVEYNESVDFALAERPGKFVPDAIDQGSKKGPLIQLKDTFDDVEMQEITGRNSQTNHTDPNVKRRWLAKPKRSGVAILLDPDDEMETSVDIKAPLPQAVARAARKYHDDQFLVGFFSPNQVGAQDALSSTPFKTANILTADAGETVGVYTGLTMEKLIRGQQLIGERFIDIEEMTPTMVLEAADVAALMRIDKFANGDYNQTKPLMNGTAVDFMGYHFKRAQITNAKAYPKASKLAVNGSGHARLPIYFPGKTVAMNKWMEFKGYDDTLPDMNHSEQFAGYSCVGAARMDEDLAFIIEVARS